MGGRLGAVAGREFGVYVWWRSLGYIGGMGRIPGGVEIVERRDYVHWVGLSVVSVIGERMWGLVEEDALKG